MKSMILTIIVSFHIKTQIFRNHYYASTNGFQPISAPVDMFLAHSETMT